MMDSALEPDGSGKSWYSKTIAGITKFFRKSDAKEFYSIDGANKRILINDTVRQIRRRCTIAEINAGVTLLAALSGYQYRMVACKAIAVGGNAGTVTTVDVLGTQSAAGVKLVAYAQANLTRSAVLEAGGTGAAVLADGASFVANDANTAVTVGKTGGSIDTATHVDILFSYIVDPV